MIEKYAVVRLKGQKLQARVLKVEGDRAVFHVPLGGSKEWNIDALEELPDWEVETLRGPWANYPNGTDVIQVGTVVRLKDEKLMARVHHWHGLMGGIFPRLDRPLAASDGHESRYWGVGVLEAVPEAEQKQYEWARIPAPEEEYQKRMKEIAQMKAEAEARATDGPEAKHAKKTLDKLGPMLNDWIRKQTLVTSASVSYIFRAWLAYSYSGILP